MYPDVKRTARLVISGSQRTRTRAPHLASIHEGLLGIR